MKILFTVLALAFLSSPAPAEMIPYLNCFVGSTRYESSQNVVFNYAEFKHTPLVAKEVELGGNRTVTLVAAYVPQDKHEVSKGFLGIDISEKEDRLLASSLHNLDMKIRDVRFEVYGLAHVICRPID